MSGRRKPAPIGQRFGRWTVVADGPDVRSPGGQKIRRVTVRCDCGREAPVALGHLKSGWSTQCRACGLRRAHQERRRRAVEALRSHAEMPADATLVERGHALGITGEGARQQLQRLLRSGYMRRRVLYEVTDAGYALLADAEAAE